MSVKARPNRKLAFPEAFVCRSLSRAFSRVFQATLPRSRWMAASFSVRTSIPLADLEVAGLHGPAGIVGEVAVGEVVHDDRSRFRCCRWLTACSSAIALSGDMVATVPQINAMLSASLNPMPGKPSINSGIMHFTFPPTSSRRRTAAANRRVYLTERRRPWSRPASAARPASQAAVLASPCVYCSRSWGLTRDRVGDVRPTR